jgi:hypothetical protein
LERLKGREHSEDLGVDGRISKWVLKEIRRESADWIYLAQDSDQWLSLVNTVINFLIP